VWLDAVDRQRIEEMGGMNLYFVYGTGDSARIMTPKLTGSLLPGITRDSLITVAADLGIRVDQGEITVDQLRAGCETGEITEVFACGTAAVITPVGTVKSRLNGSFDVSGGKSGEITLALRDALLDIQSGAVVDRHNWMHSLVNG
jgi:branched-chain amino acid aminotransferase